MSHILTLVAAEKNLNENHIQHICDSLELKNGELAKDPHWLEDEKAVDLFIAQKPDKSQIISLKKKMTEHKIDVFITCQENRRKKLLIADMDSTILATETLDDLASCLGLKNEISEITDKAMRGELNFPEALKARVNMMAGLAYGEIEKQLDQLTFSGNAIQTIQTLSKNGCVCVLVSGGFIPFARKVAETAGFDHFHANRLEIKDGRLTGAVFDPILDGQIKEDILIHYTRLYNLEDHQTIAVGDGANDLKMLKKANLGIGYRPKPKLARSLKNIIRHTDLSSLLYMQGYEKNDIINH